MKYLLLLALLATACRTPTEPMRYKCTKTLVLVAPPHDSSFMYRAPITGIPCDR